MTAGARDDVRPDGWQTAEHVVDYILGRLSAIEYETEKLKNQRADRRYQIAVNIRTEVARLRWACGFIGRERDQPLTVVVPQLAEFARLVLEHWPEGGPDGGDLQDIGERTGVLVPRAMGQPCGAHCRCLEYHAPEDWPVTCYRVNLDATVTDPRVLKQHGGDA